MPSRPSASRNHNQVDYFPLFVVIVTRAPRLTCLSFFTTVSERAYITVRACELEFGGTMGLLAAVAGGLRPTAKSSSIVPRIN